MSGSSGSQPTQTTTSGLSPEQKAITNLAMPGIREFAANVPTRYPGSTVAGFDPSQTSGQEMALGAANTQGMIGGGAADAVPFYFGDIWNPSSNPNLQGAIDAATRPIAQHLTEDELPAIRSDFGGANYGSSRQAIAEGLATGRANQAIGDTASKLAENEYDTNIRSQLQAFGLLPTIDQALTTPALTTSGVGDVRQALTQAKLGEQVGNYNFDQYAPYLQAKDLLALAGGLPGGSVTSTANNPPSGPTAMTALGGAAAGATLGSAIMPGVGTLIGAGGGALLPFLFPQHA